MLLFSGMKDVAIAQAKKEMAAYEQECELHGNAPTEQGRAAVITRLARKNQVDPSIVRAHLYPTWNEEQLEFFSAKFDKVPQSMEHETISEWCRQTGVTMAYACEQLGIDSPTPEVRKKRTRTVKRSTPKLKKEMSDGPHNSAMVSGAN